MARPLRIEFPGAFYHVTSRGNARSAIYLDRDDRNHWLSLLEEVCEQFNWRCFTYCQMGNHFHLLIETRDATLARGMRQLNGVYTQSFNRRHAKCGHLLQGRYHAVIVDEHSYLLELVRYILLNPVRAGMVERVNDWPWSSYRFTCAAHSAPSWLATADVLNLFGHSAAQAVVSFQRFVHAGLTAPSPWTDLQNDIYLGDADFIERVQARMTTAQHLDKEIPRPQRSPKAPALPSNLQSPTAVDAAIVGLYRSGHYTQRQLANHFDVHYSTISRRLRKAKMLTGKT